MKHVCFDIETERLDPLTHRVTAIGIKTYDEERVFINKDESLLLKEFWNYLWGKDFMLIGFNSKTFDD